MMATSTVSRKITKKTGTEKTETVILWVPQEIDRASADLQESKLGQDNGWNSEMLEARPAGTPMPLWTCLGWLEGGALGSREDQIKGYAGNGSD
jgi:hypothetical protein